MMKKVIITLIGTVFLLTVSHAQDRLKIDPAKSTVKWIGEYSFYFGGHEGTIDIMDGYFLKTDVITGGTFTIDMTSILSTDMEPSEAKDNLEKHLKDEDFFDTKTYPVALITITDVQYGSNDGIHFKADLTIKGITNPIKFNATADYASESITTKFRIDRRRWNVNYTSKLRDSAISDAIGFEIKLSL